MQNPYPFYDQARAAGDFFWWEDYGMACAVSHRAVSAVLRDKSMGRAAPDDLAPTFNPGVAAFDAIEAHSMLELEPPDHTRLRGLVLRAFTSRSIARLAPQIRTLCADLIAGFPDGPFDLITAYAQPLPVIIIARLLGVPVQDADQLLVWSNAMVAMYQARRTPQIAQDANHAATEFAEYLTRHINAKQLSPSDDLLSDLIAARDDGDRLSEDELISTAILLLNAGHEATVHTLGNTVKTQLELSDTESSATAIEEHLRYDPPLHMFTRWVYKPTHVFGHDFQPGDKIGCLLGAAGRDPQVYDQPHQFNSNRRGPAHMAFGAGIHFCVGAPLARLEMQIALEMLHKACPNLELAEAPQYADLYHFHGLKRLLVRR